MKQEKEKAIGVPENAFRELKPLPIRIRMWRTALGLSPDIKRINCVSRCRETRCLLIGILGMDKPILR